MDELKELEENKLKIEKQIDEKKVALNEEQSNLRDEIEFFSEDSKEVQGRRETVKLLEKDVRELEKLDKIAKMRWGELLRSKTPKQDNSAQEIVIKFGPGEYMRLGKIAKAFTDKGISGAPPKFVMITGGVASGKTTVRRQSFAKDYVNLDYWDIYLATEREFGRGDPRLVGFVSLLGDMILYGSIEAKKNIVIEMIGADESLFKSVMDSMKDIGYDLVMQLVICDPIQAYERHLKAVETDEDYQSAHYTERPTLSFFYAYFKLGNMPPLPEGYNNDK